MPKVANKRFKYTAKGMKAAKAYAKKTGSKVFDILDSFSFFLHGVQVFFHRVTT